MATMLLVTANIASCFDQLEVMLQPWLDEVFKVIRDNHPQFIAIHCQEVGGKKYENSSQNIEDFVKNILARAEQLNYTKMRVFIDAAYTLAEKYTALGSFYFIESGVDDIKVWDFKDGKYIDCCGVEKHIGHIEDIPTKQKDKFPQEFFPECKWSRKGFLRTRWSIRGTQLDLVNMHLFHDASNLIAMDSCPSVYTLNRKRAVQHTLDRFHNDEFENVPLFLFGDFNFRVDTKGVIQSLTKGCSVEEGIEEGEKMRLYKKEGKTVLSVSKKYFKHSDHDSVFINENGRWLRQFDKELDAFASRLFEFPIHFPPSYPFEEGMDSEDGKLYMKTRCPSWCDRIIFTKNAKSLIEQHDAGSGVKYGIIGLESHMGDHKPVGMQVELPFGKGVVRCCSPPQQLCTNFVHAPEAKCFLNSTWCGCLSHSSPGLPLPSQLFPLTSALVDPRSGEIEADLLEPNACSGGVVEVDLTQTSKGIDPSLEDQLKLFDKADYCLKRIHSVPVTIQYGEKAENYGNISSLEYIQSLDAPSRSRLRLKLRTDSSRLFSHHSSSSEEWFEEVPLTPSPEVEGNRTAINVPRKTESPQSSTKCDFDISNKPFTPSDNSQNETADDTPNYYSIPIDKFVVDNTISYPDSICDDNKIESIPLAKSSEECYPHITKGKPNEKEGILSACIRCCCCSCINA